MKLIVAGASGSVATEVIRQSLSVPRITSVVAISRRPISKPANLGQGVDSSKLHNVLVGNYDTYPDEVRKQLAGAEACIWTVAITPSKSRGLPFDEVRRVCLDYTVAGLQAIFQAQDEGRTRDSKPLRFLYMSGAAAERDQSKSPTMMAEYCLMRGETENQVLAFAEKHKGAIETCVAKPGLIVAPGQYLKMITTTVVNYVTPVPRVSVAECSAALLHEVVHGFTKEPLENDDLVKIGREALAEIK